MPSPQTPLPERARGFENLQLFLAPLLLLWEKGLGDEGKRFVSQSATLLVLWQPNPGIEAFLAISLPFSRFMGKGGDGGNRTHARIKVVTGEC
jgi:hypothetical protein